MHFTENSAFGKSILIYLGWFYRLILNLPDFAPQLEEDRFGSGKSRRNLHFLSISSPRYCKNLKNVFLYTGADDYP
jgi:hypothetical protein